MYREAGLSGGLQLAVTLSECKILIFCCQQNQRDVAKRIRMLRGVQGVSFHTRSMARLRHSGYLTRPIMMLFTPPVLQLAGP